MGIEFKEGAVCFADGEYHYHARKGFVEDSQGFETSFLNIMNYSDFQLNTIKKGDCIEASEIDTEQKYNDAVGVIGLFGYKDCSNYGGLEGRYTLLVDLSGDVCTCSPRQHEAKRKLTYNQIMAIGELKNLEFERETLLSYGVYAPSKSSDSENPSSCEDVVNKPLHYQFFEGVEVIEIIASSMTREQFKGYCLGNRIKYRLRAGNKDKLEQEIAKSDKYVELYDEHKHLCRNGGDLK